MPELGLRLFDRTVHEANTWLEEISEEMNHPDKQMAYHALRGVLFTLRDRLDPHEALDLAAQLPVLIRGIYFEGYKLADKPLTFRDREAFLQRVSAELEDAGHANPEEATRAVFTVLNRHIDEGEARHTREMLPQDIRALWPNGSA